MNVNSSISFLSHIHTITATFLTEKLKQQGFNDFASSHGNILFQLNKNGKMTMGELAKAINRDKSTATVLVRKLENEGFVSIINDENDKRNKYILLSKKGMEYTGNLIDLVPVIYNNEKLFRFVHFSDEKRNQVNTEVNVESRLIPLRLEKDNCIKMNDSIFLKETSSTVYICINTFEIDDKELNNQFSDLQKQISTIDFTNKDLVINLRNNLGGYENFVKEFIKNLILATMKVSPLDAQLYINETEKGIVSLMSPLLSEQVYLQYMQLSDSISEYLIDQVKNRYFELKENPRRYYIDYDSVVSKKVTENNSSINKVYVLMNNDTVSAAELVIALSYIFGQDKVCLLGNNSRGSLDYGSVFKYELPNSGIKIILPSNSNKKCNYLSKNPNWHGDTKGFYPDYWATNENILDTLVYLTKDEELRTVLADLDKGLQ